MYEKQLPPLPPQSAWDRTSPRTGNPLSYVNREAQPGSDILASLEQEILKLRRENDALRRSMVEKEAKIEMLQNLNSQHRQQIDEQTRQAAQLFQITHSAIETYRDDKKDQTGHLPRRSSEEIATGSKRLGPERTGAARRSALASCLRFCCGEYDHLPSEKTAEDRVLGNRTGKGIL
ncbi:hypothetical protein B0T10DRAFT_580453 [Thelonectria olida]|uniref:Uncharacterized protein n=1 Tax=Thelonectria olida TaxID=1576542 RepID=A0A9P8VWW8_9HYPO|nr:hypothetical protein B0T10DRAFT_580453 [Thelonectria olida]